MSVHRSLKSANTMRRHRSVLSRLERARILQEKGSLDLESSSVLGLPKVKHLKIKIRKEKAAAAAGETPAAGTAGTGAAPAPAAGAKPGGGTRPGAAAPAEAGKSKKPAG